MLELRVFVSISLLVSLTDVVIGCPPRWITYTRQKLPVTFGVATQYFSEIDNENSNGADAAYGSDWVILDQRDHKDEKRGCDRLAQALEAGFKVVACVSVDRANNGNVYTEMDLLARIKALAPSIKDWSRLVIAVDVTSLSKNSSRSDIPKTVYKKSDLSQSASFSQSFEPRDMKDSVQRCNVCNVNTHSCKNSFRCKSSLTTPLQVQKVLASLRQWLRVNVSQEAANVTRLLLLTKSYMSMDFHREFAKIHELDGFLVESGQALSSDILGMVNTARYSTTELLLKHKQIKSTTHLIRNLKNEHFTNKTTKVRSL